MRDKAGYRAANSYAEQGPKWAFPEQFGRLLAVAFGKACLTLTLFPFLPAALGSAERWLGWLRWG